MLNPWGLGGSQVGANTSASPPVACGNSSLSSGGVSQSTLRKRRHEECSSSMLVPAQGERLIRPGGDLRYAKGRLVADGGYLQLMVMPESNFTGSEEAGITGSAKTMDTTSDEPDSTSRLRYKRLTVEDLRPYFNLSLNDAATALEICPTTLKRTCRRLGLKNWPRKALADAEAARLTASAAPDAWQSSPLRCAPRLFCSLAGNDSLTVGCLGGKYATSEASGSQKTGFSLGGGPSIGGGGATRVSAFKMPTPMSSRESGTVAPDMAAEDSSSAAGGRSINQGDSAGLGLRQTSLPTICPPLWLRPPAAQVLHALPHGISSNICQAVGAGPHVMPPTFGMVLSPLQGAAPRMPLLPVQGQRWMNPMAVNSLPGLGAGPRPMPAATVVGPHAMPSTVVGPHAMPSTVVGPHAMPSTVVGPHAMPSTGIRAPFSQNAALQPSPFNTFMWAPTGGSPAGWAAPVAPAPMPVLQLLPIGAGMPQAPPHSLFGWSPPPQPVASLPQGAPVPRYVSGARTMGHGSADAMHIAPLQIQPLDPWKSAAISPSGDATAAKAGESHKGGDLASLSPAKVGFVDLLTKAPGGMTPQFHQGLLANQAMVKGAQLAGQDVGLPVLNPGFNPLGACPSPAGSLINAHHWATHMRQGSVHQTIPAQMQPELQSDGTVLTPLGYAPREYPQAQIPWPMHVGEARAFNVTGGDVTDPGCGNSLEDLWPDEGLQTSLSFPTL